MITLPPPELLAHLPRIYETESIPVSEKIIHLRFFIQNCEWLAAEFDGEDIFFGYACLGDPDMAEFGYFSLAELKSIKIRVPFVDMNTVHLIGALPVHVEWDQHWQPKPFSEIRLTSSSHVPSS